MNNEVEIDALLSFDPLDMAEKITGSSSHEDDSPALRLGMLLMMDHSAKKEAALRAAGDSHMNITAVDFIQLCLLNGFELVYREEFTNRWDDKNVYFVFAHRDGLILDFDTFYYDKENVETKVNSGDVHYQVTLNDISDFGKVVSSGGIREVDDTDILVGYKDCREGVFHHINKLKKHGTLNPIWPHKTKAPWMVHHGDHHKIQQMGKDGQLGGFGELSEYDNITSERVAKFPQWVKDMIGFENV